MKERRAEAVTRDDVEEIVRDVIAKEITPTLKEMSEAMTVLKPFIEGIQGSKAMSTGFKWVAGIIITLAGALFALKQIYSLIHY